MGFGHRVYKSYDPRAKLIKKVADEVFEQTGLNPKLEIALELERIALEDEYFIKRKLYPNVDFYSGLIYQAMGYPTEYFTVLFALGRMPGWLAQWEEMLLDKDQKIARPRQIFTGSGGAAVRPDRQALRRHERPARHSALRAAPVPSRSPTSPPRPTPRAALYEPPRATVKASGPSRPAPSSGSVRGTGCSSGSRRTPSGSWAASSTSPPTASTGISPARAATRRRSSGRASRATAGSSPTGTSRARSAGAPTRSSGSASRRATGWRSTCRWCPRPRSRCSPARGSARCTRWSSAASPPSRVRDRINDAEAKVLITADGGYRRGQVVPLKRWPTQAMAAGAVDRALHRGAAAPRRRRATSRSPR